jgi:hypothetical protein
VNGVGPRETHRETSTDGIRKLEAGFLILISSFLSLPLAHRPTLYYISFFSLVTANEGRKNFYDFAVLLGSVEVRRFIRGITGLIFDTLLVQVVGGYSFSLCNFANWSGHYSTRLKSLQPSIRCFE